PDLIWVVLGIVQSGCAYVPLDVFAPETMNRWILEDSEPIAVITDREHAGRLPDVNSTVLVLEDFRNESEQRPAVPAVSSDSLINVMYTSGTTGRPKGVQITHRNIARMVSDTAYLPKARDRRFLQVSNQAFDAFTYELWTSLIRGGVLCSIPRETFLKPQDFASWIQRYRPEIVLVTAALFNNLCTEHPNMFNGMTQVMFGGDRIDPNGARRVMEAGGPERLVNLYGPTEATVFVTWHGAKVSDTELPSIPIGSPIAHTELYVLDDRLETVPVEVTGELYMSGLGLARGYLGKPALTAMSFVPDPYAHLHGRKGARMYRSGDLVSRLPEGPLLFQGRKDHQLKIRGFR
ncbi:MAG: amino acid adenylation domain-containing protein, partial [Pseudomonadales bacterium]|nr:amino acid adenylation domain-containing protein [Pseudomonadales bacterium]